MLTSRNIDRFFDNSGWKLEYVWDRYSADNTLLLLPDADNEKEEEQLRAIVSMNESSFEESLIIDAFIKSCPRTPFVIREANLLKSLEILEDRLGMLIPTDDDGRRNFSEFNVEAQKFYDFLNVCLLLDKNDNPFVYQVLEEGWEKFVPAKPKKPYEIDNLLEDMYELACYSEHLIDVLKSLSIMFIHILEEGEKDPKVIRSNLSDYIHSVRLMTRSFNKNDRIKKDNYNIIKKNIMNILSYFEITYISEDEIDELLG